MYVGMPKMIFSGLNVDIDVTIFDEYLVVVVNSVVFGRGLTMLVPEFHSVISRDALGWCWWRGSD